MPWLRKHYALCLALRLRMDLPSRASVLADSTGRFIGSVAALWVAPATAVACCILVLSDRSAIIHSARYHTE